MALINCTGCGHEVSDKATECPHCGHPISQGKRNICKECGEPIPDNASICPNCGCPIESVKTAQVDMYEEKPPKKKWWIWALAIMLLCLIGGGVYYTYVYFTNKSLGNTESTDSGNDKDAIVEITPEFIKALEVYDELAPFSEGYAAVRRGKKWGYINTKGEEVIACSFDYADFFSEGLSAVCQDERWGFIDTNGNIVIPMEYKEEPTPFGEGLAGIKRNNKFGWINTKGQEIIQPLTDAIAVGQFSEGLVFVLKEDLEDFMFLDKEGNVKFKGKCNGDIYFCPMMSSICEEFPRFHNGLVYVANPEDYPKPQKYTQFDKNGNKLKVISKQPNGFVHFAQGDNGKETSVEDVLINVDESSTIGLKDVDDNIIIPAQYSWAYTHFSNGVFLVALDDETIRYWGYADLKGNDTFTDDVRKKCADSKKFEEEYDNVNGDFSESEWEEIQTQRRHDSAMQYDEDNPSSEDRAIQYEKNNPSSEDLSWIQGNWKCYVDVFGEQKEERVGISSEYISIFLDGKHYYTGPYEIHGDMLSCKDMYLIIDRNRKVIMADKKTDMYRF